MKHFDAFLSYAGADIELATWLHDELEKSKLNVFLDKYDLVPGTPTASGLAEAVRGSTYFVPLVTRAFAERQWPLYEIESALTHAPIGKVIPVLYGVARNDVPDVLRPFTALIISRDGSGGGEPVDVLIAVLQGKDVAALRRQRREPRPDPQYPDARTRDVGERQDALFRERALAEAEGKDTRELTQRILALRREIRSGPQLRAGDHLGNGRYQLIEIIGSGGFATVWKAYDNRDTHVVAVKLLHGQHHRDASMVERFFRGAKTMAKLHHPGIASIVDAKGEEDGYLYFVMEYLRGGDVRQAVASGGLRGADGLRMLLVVGEALAFAHRKGLVHRDVKPDNILLDEVGGPRLTDFDLVRDATTTGGTMFGLGTFMYAAPEARADASNVGPTADVYSLGMTALFVLFGGEMPPLAASRPEDVLEQSNGERTLRKVVARAIAFDARERFASIELFCEALREALDSGEASAAPWAAALDAPPRPLLLSAHHVRLQFGDIIVVRDFSLAILQGELVGIVGSSGSGASIIFRVLAGRLRPAQGDVRLRGRALDPFRLGLVDHKAFAPGLTIGELLRHQIVVHIGTEPGAEATERVRAVLDAVELDEQIQRHTPAEISTGIQQRLAVALELAADPECLFIDDATRDLDPHVARLIVRLCRARAARGQTTVMTMSALSDAEFFLFDRILVLSRGELVWFGPPHEAVSWFERRTGTPSPTTRTALDFLHEGLVQESLDGVPLEREEYEHYQQYVDEAGRRDVTTAAELTPATDRVGALRRLYAQQMRRRRMYLLIRFAQPPLLAVVILLLAQRLLDVFDFVFAFGVIVAFWLGASGAANEIVRERGFFLHQRDGGTPPRDFILAKLPIQVLLISLQVGLLLLTSIPILTWSHREWFDSSLWAFPAIMWAVGTVAMLSGLAGSAVAAVILGVGRRAPTGWLVSIALVTLAIVVLAPRIVQAVVADPGLMMIVNAIVAGLAIVPAYFLAIRAAAWGR